MDTDLSLTVKRLSTRCSLALATIALVALISGCSKSAHSVATSHSDLFTTAPLKDEWDTVTAAMQTNGFAVAAITLKKMRVETPTPTPDQLNAINDTIQSLNQQMLDLANKGDANARNALEQLKGSQPHR